MNSKLTKGIYHFRNEEIAHERIIKVAIHGDDPQDKRNVKLAQDKLGAIHFLENNDCAIDPESIAYCLN